PQFKHMSGKHGRKRCFSSVPEAGKNRRFAIFGLKSGSKGHFVISAFWVSRSSAIIQRPRARSRICAFLISRNPRSARCLQASCTRTPLGNQAEEADNIRRTIEAKQPDRAALWARLMSHRLGKEVLYAAPGE